ncbi:hypothetical protein OC861_007013, partial [Tilletia horrida]
PWRRPCSSTHNTTFPNPKDCCRWVSNGAKWSGVSDRQSTRRSKPWQPYCSCGTIAF